MDTQHLNAIETSWTLVDRAHSGESTAIAAARNQLLDRYCGAAHRYLIAATKNRSDAAELFQEFALRLIRGDFRRAEPARGRFRDYVKKALVNLIHDYHRRRVTEGLPLPNEIPAQNDGQTQHNAQVDELFIESWRAEILNRTWNELQAVNQSMHVVLRTQVDLPNATAKEKAVQVERCLGEPFDANRYRVTLHRARDKFCGLLKREVAATLADPTDEHISDELKQLRLLRYVQPHKES